MLWIIDAGRINGWHECHPFMRDETEIFPNFHYRSPV